VADHSCDCLCECCWILQTWEEAQKIEIIKKGKEITSDVAEKAASAAARGSEQLSKTNVFKSVSEVNFRRSPTDAAASVQHLLWRSCQ